MTTLDDFLNHLREDGRSPRTVDGYHHDLAACLDWAQAQTGRSLDLLNLTAFDLQRYRQHLIDAGHKPATVNRALAALRAFWGWAIEQGRAASNPAAGLARIRQDRRTAQGLSKQEVYLLQRQAAERRQVAEVQAGFDADGRPVLTPSVVAARRDEALLALLCFAGLRVSEAVGLKRRDLSLNDRSGQVRVYGKGDRYREVPLNAEARRALQAYLDVAPGEQEEPLFLGQRGGLKVGGVEAILRKIGQAAGVSVTPHQLRHTFATRLLREVGTDLVTVSTLLGHSSIATTTLYTQPGEQTLVEAVEGLAS